MRSRMIPLLRLLVIVAWAIGSVQAESAATTTTVAAKVSPASSPNSQMQQADQQKPISVHIINLDRDATRWECVTSGLVQQGSVEPSQIHRIPAVYGKTLTWQQLVDNTTFVARHFLTRGTIGCFLSHRTFWESTAALPNDDDYQICLEDDVVVCPDFIDRVAEILQELEMEGNHNDWDVIFLGALGCVHPDGKFGLNRIAAFMAGGGRRRTQISQHVHVPRRALGAHAYLLSKRGAKKLLREAWRVSGHVDVVAWGMPSLKLYSVHPMLAHQGMELPSTIGAVTQGMETKLPKLVVDDYTGIRLEWIFNAPVLQLGPVLLTMGRSVLYIVGGYVVGFLLRQKFPWFLPIHSVIFAILFVLTKATTLRSPGPSRMTIEELS